MCMFSGSVEAVQNTRIFARLTGAGTQYIVYSMAYATDQETAMILPLPVSTHDEDTAVRFLSLKDYPNFFGDMVKGFPRLDPAQKEDTFSLVSPPRTLKVRQVGDYEASFVPTIADFNRLDPRFRLPEHVWQELPSQYQDYGFAVFKLRVPPGKEKAEAHPMAFEFATRLTDTLFFPTVHVHDEEVHETAHFDHMLYYQGTDITHPAAQQYFLHGLPITKECWQRLPMSSASGGQSFFSSTRRAKSFINVERAKGIVEAEQECHVALLGGILLNQDTLLKCQDAAKV